MSLSYSIAISCAPSMYGAPGACPQNQSCGYASHLEADRTHRCSSHAPAHSWRRLIWAGASMSTESVSQPSTHRTCSSLDASACVEELARHCPRLVKLFLTAVRSVCSAPHIAPHDAGQVQQRPVPRCALSALARASAARHAGLSAHYSP
jgi:hypothetical protein